MKTCTVCKVKKELDQYYRLKRVKSGRLARCISCHLEYGRSYEDKRGREYRVWKDMKDRCSNPKSDDYDDYGQRGIKVYSEWIKSYDSFIDYVGKRPSDEHSIDRINNEGNYEPGNVKWSTSSEQKQNRRVFSSNLSGYTGVFFNKKSNKWQANIGYKSKSVYLGSFDEIEGAIDARKQGELKYWNKESIS